MKTDRTSDTHRRVLAIPEDHVRIQQLLPTIRGAPIACACRGLNIRRSMTPAWSVIPAITGQGEHSVRVRRLPYGAEINGSDRA